MITANITFYCIEEWKHLEHQSLNAVSIYICIFWAFSLQNMLFQPVNLHVFLFSNVMGQVISSSSILFSFFPQSGSLVDSLPNQTICNSYLFEINYTPTIILPVVYPP